MNKYFYGLIRISRTIFIQQILFKGFFNRMTSSIHIQIESYRKYNVNYLFIIILLFYVSLCF